MLTRLPIGVQTNYENFSEDLPSVSMTSVVQIELQISLRIFEKIHNGPLGILSDLGETDPWKKLEFKILWHCPFKEEGGWRLVHVLPELLLVHPGLLVLPPLLLLLLPLQVLHPLLHTDVKALLWGLIKRQYLVGPLTKGKPDKCTRYSFPSLDISILKYLLQYSLSEFYDYKTQYALFFIVFF